MTVIERRAGWYADPWQQASWRYWTGTRWTRATSGLATAGAERYARERLALRLEAGAAPSPWPPPPPMLPISWQAVQPPEVADRRIDLPASAFGWAMLGLLIGIVASAAGSILASFLTDNLALELLVSQSLLWFGLLGAVVFNSHRYGTGHIRDDYRVAFRGVDIPIGLGLSLGARVAAGIVTVVILRLLGSDIDRFTNAVDDYRRSNVAFVITIVIVVVGAPIVEELYFRGVVMRSLEPSLRPAGAIAVQAAIFGSLHVNPDASWKQNVALVAALGITGAGLGIIAYIARRLGPSMWTHAFFNTVAAIVMIADPDAVLIPLRHL
jgi:membrane protease YdiL (CAAX protease family)